MCPPKYREQNAENRVILRWRVPTQLRNVVCAIEYLSNTHQERFSMTADSRNPRFIE
nr:hypothetical protein CE91St29_19870 [Corynebacterium striatum]